VYVGYYRYRGYIELLRYPPTPPLHLLLVGSVGHSLVPPPCHSYVLPVRGECSRREPGYRSPREWVEVRGILYLTTSLGVYRCVGVLYI